MKIADFSVNRPVATLMLTLIIIVVGIYGFIQLRIDLLPKIEYPTLTIITNYEGVAPEEIEKLITNPIEEAVSTVPDVKEVKSDSTMGTSTVTVEFSWGKDLGEAANDIRDRLNRIVQYLPEDADQPLILKFNLNEMPTMIYTIYSEENRDIYEVEKYAKDVIKPFFEHIDGVARVMVIGAWPKEFKVLIDRDKLYGYGIPYEQLMQKIAYENVNVSGGFIERGHKELSVRSIGEFTTADELKSLIVGSSPDGRIIYLSDVADVREGPTEERGFGRLEGKRGVAIIISKQGDANTVEVASKIKESIPVLKTKLPDDIKMVLSIDMSSSIVKSIRNTAWAALEGALLAFIIVFLFLRNIRPTFIVSIAIPTSLMAAFSLLYFKNMTLNVITLGGLTIALGRLVDDAIVVTENTFRHLSLGEDRHTSAKKGANEVGMAITSSTLVTIAVFFPLVFVSGITGELFRPFSYAVIAAMLASLFVALTIVPMLSSKILSKFAGAEKERGLYYRFRKWYGRVLAWSLRNKWKVLIVSIGIFFASLLLLIPMGKEFMPEMAEDYSYVMLELPPGTGLKTTGTAVEEMEKKVMKDPDVATLFDFYGESTSGGGGSRMGESGANGGFLVITMNPRSERTSSFGDFHKRLREYARGIPDLRLEIMTMTSVVAMGGLRPIDINITGLDLKELEDITKDVENVLKETNGIVDIDNSMKKGVPELHIRYDREKLSRCGLTVGQVANLVRMALEGKVVSRIHKEGEEFDVRLRFLEVNRKTIEDVENIPVHSPIGFNFLLKDVATIEEASGPQKISHINQRRVGEISASLQNRSLGEAVKEVKQKMKSVESKLPAGYLIDFKGQYEKMTETFKNLFFVVIFAMLLIYMIMAAQFESLVHPLAIMFSIPFAFTGAFISLYITGMTLNIESFIGLIFLVGIVVTNAIVLVAFVNQLRREKGYKIDEALVEAGKVRLRPILMTALATIFAMIPMALALREGQEMEQGMAIAVIGGLFTSTVLTLIIVPIMYKILEGWAGRIRRRTTRMLHGDEEEYSVGE